MIDEHLQPSSDGHYRDDWAINVSGNITIDDGEKSQQADWVLDKSGAFVVESPQITSTWPVPFFNTLPHVYVGQINSGALSDTLWASQWEDPTLGGFEFHSIGLYDEFTNEMLAAKSDAHRALDDSILQNIDWDTYIESESDTDVPWVDLLIPNPAGEMIASRWDSGNVHYFSHRYDEWGHYRFLSHQRGLLRVRWLEVLDGYKASGPVVLATHDLSLFGGDSGVSSDVFNADPPTVPGGGDLYVCTVPSEIQLQTPSVAPEPNAPRLYTRNAIFVGQIANLDLGPNPSSAANQSISDAIGLSRYGAVTIQIGGDAGAVQLEAVDQALIASVGLKEAVKQGQVIASGSSLVPYLFPSSGNASAIVAVGSAPGTAIITIHLKNYYYTTDVVKKLSIYSMPQLAVDANRDGQIDIASLGNATVSADMTTIDHPYRFWINDDDDEIVTATALGVVETETEQDDKNITDVSKQNWRGNVITCERDLEDFARIQVSLSGLADAVKNGQLYLGLKWKNTTGTPSIKLFRATDADASTGYLTTPSAATRQALEVAIIDARYPNYAPDGQFASDHTLIEGTDVFVIPSLQFVNLSESNPRTNFLFEGCKVGTGQLALVILKKETDGSFTTIGEGPGVWMDLKEPKEFVQRWTCGDGDRGAVSAVTLDPSKSGTFGAPTTDEEKDMVLYVHGYNMQEFEKQRWLETTYKRLWHLGYKGRVGAFTWPCAQSSVPFDQSEEKAWQAGAQLLALLNTLKSQGYRVHLLGHSQGNVVIGEALRQAGPNSAVATTYIASQAAIPAHCYDAGQPDRSGATAFTPDTPNIYSRFRTANEDPYLPANWSTSDPAYLVQTQLQGSVGKFVNFFNPQDYALSGNGISLFADDGTQPGWLADQRLKPDLGWGYNGTDGFVQVTGAAEAPSVTRLTVALSAERYQIFAYCAEARSLALGASSGMGGVFSGSEINLTNDPFNFRNQHIYHSGQFRSFYAQRWQYWQQLLKSSDITVRDTP